MFRQRLGYRRRLGEAAPDASPLNGSSEAIQQRGKHGIPGSQRDEAVELHVPRHKVVHGRVLIHRSEGLLKFGYLLGCHSAGSGRRGGALERSPHREEIEDRVVLMEIHDE